MNYNILSLPKIVKKKCLRSLRRSHLNHIKIIYNHYLFILVSMLLDATGRTENVFVVTERHLKKIVGNVKKYKLRITTVQD